MLELISFYFYIKAYTLYDDKTSADVSENDHKKVLFFTIF